MSKGVLIDRVGLLFFLENVMYDVIGKDSRKCYCIWSGVLYTKTRRFIITVVLIRFGEIPVPIPNTEVKSNSVDDTCTISAGKVD